MKSWISSLILLAGLLLGGCASTGGRDLGPTTLQNAQQPYPPGELLDVGIEVFAGGETNEQAMAKQHSSAQIRAAEVQYMPYQLKNTLEQTGYWGDVRVVPNQAEGPDVRIEGTVLQSNGERLKLRIHVEDAQGYEWFTRTYQDGATRGAYADAKIGERDPFQNVYNAIANDLAAVRRTMDGHEVKTLRRTTELRFAADVVPEAYGPYVQKDDNGKLTVVRLPAEDDPMWLRVQKISQRNDMFFDALNAYYEPYYQRVWSAYLDWRKYNLVEQVSLRESRSAGIKQAATGILMIAMAVLLEMNDVKNSNTLRDVLVIAGSQVVINGVNVTKAAKIHEETLKELRDSFSSDVATVVVTLRGETVTLTGTAEEKMAQWRDLLHRISLEENALPGDGAGGTGPAP